jgi:hypothetical protein
MSECVLREDEKGLTLRVRVQPGASRSAVAGVAEGSLRLRLTAPPVEGAANQECVRYLSKTLHVAKSRICILRGHRSRDKVLRIEGIGKTDLERIL